MTEEPILEHNTITYAYRGLVPVTMDGVPQSLPVETFVSCVVAVHTPQPNATQVHCNGIQLLDTLTDIATTHNGTLVTELPAHLSWPHQFKAGQVDFIGHAEPLLQCKDSGYAYYTGADGVEASFTQTADAFMCKEDLIYPQHSWLAMAWLIPLLLVGLALVWQFYRNPASITHNAACRLLFGWCDRDDTTASSLHTPTEEETIARVLGFELESQREDEDYLLFRENAKRRGVRISSPAEAQRYMQQAHKQFDVSKQIASIFSLELTEEEDVEAFKLVLRKARAAGFNIQSVKDAEQYRAHIESQESEGNHSTSATASGPTELLLDLDAAVLAEPMAGAGAAAGAGASVDATQDTPHGGKTVDNRASGARKTLTGWVASARSLWASASSAVRATSPGNRSVTMEGGGAPLIGHTIELGPVAGGSGEADAKNGPGYTPPPTNT